MILRWLSSRMVRYLGQGSLIWVIPVKTISTSITAATLPALHLTTTVRTAVSVELFCPRCRLSVSTVQINCGEGG